MSSTITSPARAGINSESFAAFLDARREPAWLRGLRQQAWETFQTQTWPDRRDEEWIRTDIRLFRADQFRLPGAAPGDAVVPSPLLSVGLELGGATTSVNSVTTATHLAPALAERGVLFGGLEELVAAQGDRLRPYFERRQLNPVHDRFASLHSACWAGGTGLVVPRGVVIDKPLHAHATMTAGGTDFGRTLIVLEDGAEATFLLEDASFDPQGSGLHCGALEVVLGAGARLRLVHLQDWNKQTWHFAHQSAQLDRDASLQWTIAALGSRLAKVNQQVLLTGPGAETQVNGVLFTEDKQHLSYHTLQRHRAPHCRSDFLYKSALQDRSRTVWRGMIAVDKQAIKTDGYQRNDNLILSPLARADSIPGLEIEADDVRCTHGSTTSRIDEELIFYAQCRGLSRREAARLIVTGYFQQVFDRITIESVREALGQAIIRRVRECD